MTDPECRPDADPRDGSEGDGGDETPIDENERVNSTSADSSSGDAGDSTDGDSTDGDSDAPPIQLSRRRLFLGGTGGLVGVGAARAIYNTVLGYGEFGMGTNLLDQDLDPLVGERLEPSYDEAYAGARVWLADDGVVAVADDGDGSGYLRFDDADAEDAAAFDAELGLNGRLEALFVDAAALAADDYTLEYSQPAQFFDRLEAAEADARPEAVTAMRATWDRRVDPEVVEAFAGVDPTDTRALVHGLVEGFRAHTTYDVPRYVAGSIEDNVIFGAADLRARFEDDVDFESLAEADGTGIFCWELVHRSMEALHAVGAREQTVPVATCYVSDRRHKHAYTGVVSAVRRDGELRLPMTFVDYTYTTLYDDVRLTGVLGEGLAAYDSRHRADEIYW